MQLLHCAPSWCSIGLCRYNRWSVPVQMGGHAASAGMLPPVRLGAGRALRGIALGVPGQLFTAASELEPAEIPGLT